MRFHWGSKARTLDILSGRIQTAKVLPQLIFTYQEWKNAENVCLSKIEGMHCNSIAVRSSARSEDTLNFSNAGRYKTHLNIGKSEAKEKIINVFDSYSELNDDDEILIQPFLENTTMSGVAFSHDPNNGSPYYVINYHEGAETDFVTSGQGGQTWRHFHSHGLNCPGNIARVIELLIELSGLTNDPLDCEFAIAEDNTLWLLQLRPLVIKKKTNDVENKSIKRSLARAHDFILGKRKPDRGLFGDRLILGLMPDWNPAEIIGCKPLPLARTTYMHLITNDIWSDGRSRYGYNPIQNTNLMYSICGIPYIDVRRSFNSFIPAELPPSISEKLVNYYLYRLQSSPELHDKVEFEIVLSSFEFNMNEKFNFLRDFGFNNQELNLIEQSLVDLTNNLVKFNASVWRADESAIEKLRINREKISKSSISLQDKFRLLINDCKTYGTRPFSGLARIGFIAVQMLNSLPIKGLLSQKRVDELLSSINTVTYQLQHDRSSLDKKEFLARYGHLRPGTYDITSPRYDAQDQFYFSSDQKEDCAPPPPLSSFRLLEVERVCITDALRSSGLKFSAEDFIEFIKAGIALRELSKFEFTKNLSMAFEVLVELGDDYNLTRKDLAFASMDAIMEAMDRPEEAECYLKKSIRSGRKSYALTQKISLPTVISDETDIFSFGSLPSIPNFITSKVVIADIENANESNNLAGKIVCIDKADPGYDWLFSRNISGLITAWGGVNSHMAIRSGELGIPAAIGVGENLFDELQTASKIKLDCLTKQIEMYA